jgi:hypothetical protein
MSLWERHRYASQRKSVVRLHGAIPRAILIAASLQNRLAQETAEILKWVARRGRRGGWQGANEAHPRRGLQRTGDAASRPFRLAPEGLRRFCRWPALLAWPRSLRISALRSRLGQRQNRQQRGPIQYFNSLLSRAKTSRAL